MYPTLVSPKSLTSLQSEWDEFKSFEFLQLYSGCKDWCCYSTKELDNQVVLALSDLFCLTHGRISHIDVDTLDYWSVRPVNVFRYKLLEDGSCDALFYVNPRYNKEGYIVEGAFWSNGFFYQVIREGANPDNYIDFLVELNLFIDKRTALMQGYPETYTMYSQLVSKFFNLPS